MTVPRSRGTQTEMTGLAYAVFDMITYGFLPVVSHYFVKTIDPLLFAGVTALLGAIPFAAKLKVMGHANEIYAKPFLTSLLQISLVTTLGAMCFFLGAKYTTGINTGLLIQLEPLYSLVIAAVVLKELIYRHQILATLFMVLGAVIVVYRGGGGINGGDILILAAPLFFQIAHLIAKRILHKVSDVDVIPAGRLLYSGVLLTIIALVLNPAAVNQLWVGSNIVALIGFSLIFRTLDSYLWYQALKRISVAKASAVIPLSAAIAFLGSIVVLREVPSPQQYVGLACILGGLIWFSVSQIRVQQRR